MRRYPFLELIAYLICLLRGRSLTSLSNPLPARGPKPCTRRHCQIRRCLPGGRSPVPVVAAKSVIACQGAKALYLSSLPNPLLPVRGPKPCTHRRIHCQAGYCLLGDRNPTPVVVTAAVAVAAMSDKKIMTWGHAARPPNTAHLWDRKNPRWIIDAYDARSCAAQFKPVNKPARRRCRWRGGFDSLGVHAPRFACGGVLKSSLHMWLIPS